MKYRLALDMGSTSLGWCLLALDQNNVPSSLINMGIRIFSDGRDDKSKEPLAVARRGARSLRRNYDRRDRRQRRLLSCLIQYGLMPQNESKRKELEALDPYEIRAKALDEEVPLHELGRVIFHINQRRGFKSNRKADKRENDSSSNMKNAIKDLDGKLLLTNSRTLGEYLWKQHLESLPVRVRSRMVKDKAEYNFYPSREMYAKELDKIFAHQKKYHPKLTDEVCEEIKDILFYQRPLKPVTVGNCRFESGEKRARLAYPLVQKYRILQEVNNLQLERLAEGDPEITPEDREKIAHALLHAKWKKAKKSLMTFGQISKVIALGSGYKYNLESDRREGLQGDDTSAFLSQEACFGSRWEEFTSEQQEKLVDLLFETQDPEELVEILITNWDVTPEQAEEIANAPLAEGYGALSKKAIEKMMPFLEQGQIYSTAAKSAGYHHSDFRTGEVFERLPYYGEILPNNVIGGSYAPEDENLPEKYFGKINNPSVHIALNQVRKLVNALIDIYGPPEEVVIELARNLKEPPDDISKEQSKNQKENKRINEELAKLGQKQNYRNRMLYKLWEDLAEDPTKRCCPFSGVQISQTDIFSGQFEEEHLLPFSRSYNDGRANKVLSSREWNRRKGNRSPFDAFAHTPEWPQMLARVQNLPKNKRWRFQEDAWEIAKGEGEDVIARMLNDTRYMSKITKAYLSAVFDNEKGKSKIWAIPGQMTALLRDKWGLNDLLGEEDGQKDRTDHRHHAIDAFVIGCSDRGMFKRLSDAAKKLEEDEKLFEKRHKLVSGMPGPFEGFLHQLQKKVEQIVISYKPDHGGASKAITAKTPYTVGPLHKETAYGFIRKGEKKGTVIVATRTPLESLKKMKNIEEIADPVICASLKNRLSGIKEDSPEWKAALANYSAENGTQRVRIHIEKTEDVLVGVKQPKDRGPEETRGKDYKYYALGGNYCAEIYCPNKGKKAGQWDCEIISNYHAHQKDHIPQWRKDNPTAKLIMRLQIDDMVAYEEEGKEIIARVKKMTGGRVYLRPHTIAKETADSLSWAASPNLLQQKNARKISVDITGRVRDSKKAQKSEGHAA
jgi:CRISPR-associated endonuclease Csn1